jgi:hypothetical protein
MLYSKYHGLLIILFTIFSNWKLILNPRAWIAVVTGVLLFFPHLYWQYQYDFPSVSYHLKERNAPAYQFAFTLEYVAGQILLAGPLIGFLLLRAANRYKTTDLLARALQWSMWGFYGFFLISTLKGRVEANWTVPALIPVIILSHAWLSENFSQRKWIFRLLTPSLVLVILVRVYMLTNISGLTRIFKDEMHGNREWVKAIKEKSNGLPVVFLNSYQRPSKYWFYSGDTSFAINTTYYRRNNYNFWPIEKEWQNRKVLVVDKDLGTIDKSFEIPTPRGITPALVNDKLQSFSHIRLSLSDKSDGFKKGQPVQLSVQVDKHSINELKQLLKDSGQPNQLVADLFVGKSMVQRLSLTASPLQENTLTLTSTENISLQPGEYIMKLGIATSVPNLYSQNSPAIVIKVN